MNNTIVAEAGKLKGIMSITVLDEFHNKVKDKCTRPFTNLITNYGLDYMLGNNVDAANASGWCGVGSSATTPQFTDTNLGSALGTRTQSTTSSTNTNSGSPTYYNSYVRTFSFTQGQVVGNVAEIAMFQTQTGATAFAHALVKDGAGTPTTITLLSTETLYITYELRYYPNLSDTSGTVVISGVTYNYTQRSKGIGGTGSPLTGASGIIFYAAGGFGYSGYETQTQAALGVTPSGTAASFTSITLNSYSNGSFLRTASLVATATDCNFTLGIGIVSWGGAGNSAHGYYTAFTPRIPKLTSESNKTLTLVLQLSLGRL